MRQRTELLFFVLVLSFIFSWTNSFSHLHNESLISSLVWTAQTVSWSSFLCLWGNLVSSSINIRGAPLSSLSFLGRLWWDLCGNPSWCVCCAVSQLQCISVSAVQCHSCTAFHAGEWLCRLQLLWNAIVEVAALAEFTLHVDTGTGGSLWRKKKGRKLGFLKC